MTDDQDIQEVLKLMSGPLPLLPSRSEGNTVILRGVAEARRRGLAAVYVADVGRGILQIGIRQFHRDVIQVEILWDDAPPPGVRLRVRLAAGAAELGPGGTEPRRRGRTRPAGREAYEAFMSRLTSLRAPESEARYDQYLRFSRRMAARCGATRWPGRRLVRRRE